MTTKVRYIVYYRRKKSADKSIHTGTHDKSIEIPDKDFRLYLLKTYIGLQKRVLSIEPLGCHTNG